MKLKVINSGSIGNCYVLENENETLLIECGVSIKEIKEAINFNVGKVVGCLATHLHNDHSKTINKVLDLGIKVYALKQTFDHHKCNNHNQNEIQHGKVFQVGSFKVMPFDVRHDVPCVGFLIDHPETGRFIFITDTYFCDYTFPDLNNVIIEANFCHDIIKQKYNRETSKEFLKNRIFKSHFSLRDCKEMLSANDLRKVQNIVLIHLSDSNSDEERFKKEVQELTGKNTICASKGLIIDFNKDLF